MLMAHSNEFIMVVKCKGACQRDMKGKNNGERDVHIPFGTEYSLYFKNKSNENGTIELTIDGTDVLGGYSFYLPARSSKTIERFVVDGDLEKGSRFKFVSLDSDDPGIVDPDSRENGLIVAKFYKEQPMWLGPVYNPNPWVCPSHPWVFPTQPCPTRPWNGTDGIHWTMTRSNTLSDCSFSTTLGKSTKSSGDSDCLSTPISSSVYQAYCCDNVKSSDKGATVEGNQSDQKFTVMNGRTFCQTPSAVVKLRLRGRIGQAVKEHVFCTECGAKIKAEHKFCFDCGARI